MQQVAVDSVKTADNSQHALQMLLGMKLLLMILTRLLTANLPVLTISSKHGCQAMRNSFVV